MWRGVETWRSLFGRGGIEAFLSGRELLVRGRRYDYAATKTIGVVRHTMRPRGMHIPYRLGIRRKEDGREITTGCVVFDGIPVVDQIIALALHVRDPEEEVELLRRTNLDWTRALAADPFLHGLKRPAARGAAQLAVA